MADYDLSIHMNPDAMAWSKFFRECNPDCNVPDDLMLGWFANAMMAMHDHILGGPTILPDGSAFISQTVPSPARQSATTVPQGGKSE
jgi:hypothetical protein